MEKIVVDGKELETPVGADKEKYAEIPHRDVELSKKQTKLIDKAKRKSEKRAKGRILSSTQNSYIIVSVICIVLGIVALSFIKGLVWKLTTGTLLIAFGTCYLLVAYEKIFRKPKKVEMLELKDFPSRIACGNNNDVLYNTETQKLLVTNICAVVSPIFDFAEISKLEVVEDNDTKVKYSLTGAMIGDWAFGTIGAIIGAKNLSKTKHFCNKLELVVYFNNVNYSNATFTFINKKTDKNSVEYKSAVMQIKDCYGRLQALMLAPKPKETADKTK